jgi:hypothetical protein
MSVENPLRGAHSELLKLGFAVAQSSVAKYMIKPRGPRDQGWGTFLRNHAFEIAAMDLLVVLTMGFVLLYAFTVPHGVEWAGNIVCRPNLGGLHHQYGRM